MGESNTIVSAYTSCRHLQWYCPHPLIYDQLVNGHGQPSTGNGIIFEMLLKIFSAIAIDLMLSNLGLRHSPHL